MHDAATIVLRSVSDEDGAFVRRLFASTRSAELALLDWSDVQRQAFLEMQFAAQCRHYLEHYPSANRQIVEMAGEPIGRLDWDVGADAIHVFEIALLPEFRGHGIGRVLMDGVLERAKSAGLPVTLYVDQDNAAIRFYRRLGFEAVQLEGMHWLMRWSAELPVRDTPMPAMNATTWPASAAPSN